MVEIDDILAQMQITRADHLPVIAAFCRRINLIEIINRVVPTEMDVSAGTIIQGMVLDTLSGRCPFNAIVRLFHAVMYCFL